MNNYPRMTLRQLCDVAREQTIYIQSDEDTTGNLVELTNYLRGCSGAMSMEVMRIYTVGETAEGAEIVAVLDIPAAWLEKEV